MCDSEIPELRLIAGDAHMSACHYAEELEGVTVESLRQTVDVTADAELFAGEIAALGPNGEEDEVEADTTDVIVEEGIAHPGVTERGLESDSGLPPEVR